MGIGLNNFRTAIESNLKWLSVSGEDKTEVTGKATKDKISVADLSKAQPGDISKAQDNIYLRGQLLEGIRKTLVSAKLMSMDQDPQTRKSTVVFHDQAVKAFFEKAEKALFGKLDKAGRYGLGTASQDLDTNTVDGLLKKLDSFRQVATAKLLDRDRCSLANESQRTAILNLDAKALSSCLNIKEKAAKKLNLTNVETVAGGAYMVCTLESKGVKQTVVVDRQGKLLNGDSGFNECRDALARCNAEWMVGSIDSKDYKSVVSIVNLLDQAEDELIAQDKPEWGISAGPLYGRPENVPILKRVIFSSLPDTLARARQIQPKGELTLNTWWSALELEGEAPKAGAKDAGFKLGLALVSKLQTDYAHVVGNVTKDDFMHMGDWDVDSIVGLPQKRKDYGAFMFNFPNGLSYQKTLFCMKYKCLPQPQDFVGGMKVRQSYLNTGVLSGYEKESNEEIKAGALTTIKTELNGTRRYAGSVYTFHDPSALDPSNSSIEFGVGNTGNTDDVCRKLLDKGFTHRQLYALSVFPNNTGSMLLELAGFSNSTNNMKVDVRVDPNNPKDLLVAYDFECVKGVPGSNNLDNATRFDQRMHVQVAIHPDGSMDCGELKLKPVDKNIVNQEGLDDVNNVPVDKGNLVHQDIVDLQTSPAQERTMLNLDGPRLGQLCGVEGEAAKGLTLSNLRMALDGQTVIGEVKKPDKSNVEVCVSKDGTILVKNEKYNEKCNNYYKACEKTHSENIEKLSNDAGFGVTSYDKLEVAKSLGPVEAAELAYLESLVDEDLDLKWLNNIHSIKGCLVKMLPGVMDKLRETGQLTGSPDTHLAALWSALKLEGDAPDAKDQDLKQKFTMALINRVCSDVLSVLGKGYTMEDVKGVSFPTTESRNAVVKKFGSGFCNVVDKWFFGALGTISGETYEDTLRSFKEVNFIPDQSRFFFAPKGGAIKNSLLGTQTIKGTTVMSEIAKVFGLSQLNSEDESIDARFKDLRIVVNGKPMEFEPRSKMKGKDVTALRAAAFEKVMHDAKFTDEQIVQSVHYLNEYLYSSFESWRIAPHNATIDIKSSSEGMRLKISLPIVKLTDFERVGLNMKGEPKYKWNENKTGQTFAQEILVQPDGSYALLASGIEKAA